MAEKAKPALKGCITYADQERVIGWALDSARPYHPVAIEIREDEDVLFETRPELFDWKLFHDGLGSGHHAFCWEVPGSLKDGQRHELQIVFKESGARLDGSPVVIDSRFEASYIPFEVSDLTGVGKVLVLAPHADDETFGVGGSLLKHRKAGDQVKVVVLTDGSKGDIQGADEPGAYIAARQQEARDACAVLGVADVVFLGLPDRALQAEEARASVLAILADWKPSLVYVTSPWEFHADHQAAAELVWKLAAEGCIDGRVAFYEVNRPMTPNTLVDISAEKPDKEAACKAYVSQLRDHPYTDYAMGIGRYRALSVSGTAEYAEALCVLDSAEIRKHPFHWFCQQQVVPQMIADRDGPLVSVVIRTKNRPALLRQALSSLVLQTWRPLEVIIVNDGGDPVSDALKPFEPLLDIHLIEQKESVGRSSAANLGIQKASGRYVNFLDDDDLLYSGHIQKLVQYMEAIGASFAYSDCEKGYYRWDADKGLVKEGVKGAFLGEPFDRDRLYYNNYIPIMTAMVRRDLFDQVGEFDAALDCFEDWDLWIRMAELEVFHHVPGVTCEYRVFGERGHDFARWRKVIYEKYKEHWCRDDVAKWAWPRIERLNEEIVSLRKALAEVQPQLEKVSTEHGRLVHEKNELLGELAGREKQASELEQRIADFEQQVEKAREGIGNLQEEGRKKDVYTAELKADLEKQIETCRSIETELANMVEDRDQTRAALDAVRSSRTWKLASRLAGLLPGGRSAGPDASS